MQLANFLPSESVRVLAGTSSKKRLFQDLGEMADSVYGMSADIVIEALTERESLGPTGVGEGVALPHARVAGLTRVCGLFVRLERAMDFESVDRQPVDLVFALLAPTDAGVDHLKALALVSRTLREAAVRSKLRANLDPTTLHTILTEVPASQAA